jgi:hypothetical protein
MYSEKPNLHDVYIPCHIKRLFHMHDIYIFSYVYRNYCRVLRTLIQNSASHKASAFNLVQFRLF